MKRNYTLQEFVQEVLLGGIKELVEKNPYLAFFVLCVDIELFGRILDPDADIHAWKKTSKYFYGAIRCREITSFAKYRPIGTNMYKKLRCGILHSGIPGVDIKLVDKNNDIPNKIIGCQALYNDIKRAWQEILDNDLAKKDLSQPIFETDGAISGMTQNAPFVIEHKEH